MWVAEGLTHRYPTKVLAELLSTCPQYCGHCTRMDLVGNSTPQIDKLKLTLKPVDRYDAHIDYLKAHPGVRDVVVSGGDVANVPWRNLESYLMRLLDIETIRDIRLATKALLRLPQHWLRAGRGRGPGAGRPHGRPARREPGHPHARQPRPVGDPAGRPGREDRARGRRLRDVRNQGVLMRGVNATTARPARPVLRAAGRGRHPAVLLLHVRHDPQRRALAGVGLARPRQLQHDMMGYLPGYATPADRVRRAVRRQALGAHAHRVRPGARHLVLDEELPHVDRGQCSRDVLDQRYAVLRPDRHAARVGPEVVAQEARGRGPVATRCRR